METTKGLYRVNEWNNAYFSKLARRQKRCTGIKNKNHCPLRYKCKRYEVSPFFPNWIKPKWTTSKELVRGKDGKILEDEKGKKIFRPVDECDNLLV